MRGFIRFTFIAVFLVSSATALAANLDKGLAAISVGDYDTAMAECQPLADEGNVEAMFCVGQLYANGFGVPMDDALAAGFYRLAAGFGYIPAQAAMGYCYKHGAGVEKDLVKAYMWFDIAAHNGDLSAASERDSLGDRLTPEEIQEGVDSALAYLASHEGQAEQVGQAE